MRLLTYLYKRAYPVKWLKKHGAKIGKNVVMGPFKGAGEPFLIEIGEGTWVSYDVSFFTHDGSPMCFSRSKDNKFLWTYGTINIGKNCFIGAGAFLFPGIKIGDNTIIGAGSVVTRSFGSDLVVAGNPARQIETIAEFQEKQKKKPLFDPTNEGLKESLVEKFGLINHQ